ncbi:MAG: hypothetical protein AB2598_16145 [Candidatus Thiodiazotropha sp.]
MGTRQIPAPVPGIYLPAQRGGRVLDSARRIEAGARQVFIRAVNPGSVDPALRDGAA